MGRDLGDQTMTIHLTSHGNCRFTQVELCLRAEIVRAEVVRTAALNGELEALKRAVSWGG